MDKILFPFGLSRHRFDLVAHTSQPKGDTTRMTHSGKWDLPKIGVATCFPNEDQ
jgi:hypothetical protein